MKYGALSKKQKFFYVLNKLQVSSAFTEAPRLLNPTDAYRVKYLKTSANKTTICLEKLNQLSNRVILRP